MQVAMPAETPPTPRPPLDPHVIVVEDEPRMRELLQRVLGQWGFDASLAKSAEEASRIADERAPDVLVLDLNLPGEGGLSFLGRMRERWPHTQAIVLTGFGSLEAAREAIHLDVVDFLTKPAHLGDLEKALDRALRRLSPAPPPPVLPQPPAEPTPGKTLEEVERDHILATLARHDGNRTATAAALGISRRTLYYKLDEYQRLGLPVD